MNRSPQIAEGSPNGLLKHGDVFRARFPEVAKRLNSPNREKCRANLSRSSDPFATVFLF